ncbi:MAG: aminotransferase class I/II-fold pyridoxal phosphate-dependent enzyme [Magnetococcales bacterium]|nr:aminotransferase class I/II-fold pyridoxal phosphate-dependent enzyme [Magnetococcales bacterium]
MGKISDHPLFNKPRLREWQERIATWKEQETDFYFQSFDGIDGPELIVAGRRILNISSYGYLGLNGHPRILRATREAVQTYGTGTFASFVSGGGLDLHQRLVAELAHHSRRDDAVLFTSGFITNVATITALVDRGDFVISDLLNHASLNDGCQRSGATARYYPHNNMAMLEKRLQQASQAIATQADHAGRGILVVCDGVFSMDGDVLNLPEVTRLCREYNALLMVDEAHSMGVLGADGGGLEDYFGLDGAIDIKMGTLSKTIPSNGGYIAANRDFTDILRYAAKGHLFSGAMSPGNAAAALEAFRVLRDEGSQRRLTLLLNLERFRTMMQSRGFEVGQGIAPDHRGNPTPMPIVPVAINDEERTLRLARYCRDNGLYVIPAAYPVVSKGKERLRVSLTAAHSAGQVAEAVGILTRGAAAVGLPLQRQEAEPATRRKVA